MSRPRILIADDDPSVLDSMSWVLREQGYEVATAPGGAQLMSELAERVPDLLVLDVVMPDHSGYDLLSRIKGDERWRDIPVLMVSSQSPDDATERTLGLGAADYIKKPFKPRELIARVQAQLRLGAVLRSTRDALRNAEQKLVRAREEVESRRQLVDILHEVTGELSADEIYHILAGRVARALALARCSVIIARTGDTHGVIASAFDAPALRGTRVDLNAYPEIRIALEQGRPVLVEDLQSDALVADVRAEWLRRGIRVPVKSVIALPFTLDGAQAGVFVLRRMLHERSLTTDDVEFADAVIKAAVAAIQMAYTIETTKTENARLEVLARTDPLTQVLNRRALTTRLSAEMDRARRYDAVLTMLMLDLDHFKEVNDRYGHLVGDDVLRVVAGFLQSAIRSVDIVARYGGEEFVVVLPETLLPGGMVFAERALAQIARHPFDIPAGRFSITASVGVAVYPGDGIATVDELFARADEALYRAKSAGRNRVAV
ncbi:MAG TPA: diguanylate cyclase [Gemmatimonadaceae bacterium]|nr:diguanylate cyclase [Gemmatimonadaceae bacterium]